MKIVFLDINGVLNTTFYHNLKPECLNNLKILTEKTGAKVVITSAWRKYEESLEAIKKTLTEYNIDVIGSTRVLGSRSAEIVAYLEGLSFSYKYVILDDMLIEGFPDNLVLVDRMVGLTNKEVLKAISILQD